MENWYVPITIVPGVGLLILSTSNLLVALSNEIKSLIMESNNYNTLIDSKIRQLKLLNAAMVFLYVSVACLVVSGLTSGLYLSVGFDFKASIYITILGIIFTLAGLLALIVYSFKAVKIKQDQFKETTT